MLASSILSVKLQHICGVMAFKSHVSVLQKRNKKKWKKNISVLGSVRAHSSGSNLLLRSWLHWPVDWSVIASSFGWSPHHGNHRLKNVYNLNGWWVVARSFSTTLSVYTQLFDQYEYASGSPWGVLTCQTKKVSYWIKHLVLSQHLSLLS